MVVFADDHQGKAAIGSIHKADQAAVYKGSVWIGFSEPIVNTEYLGQAVHGQEMSFCPPLKGELVAPSSTIQSCPG